MRIRTPHITGKNLRPRRLENALTTIIVRLHCASVFGGFERPFLITIPGGGHRFGAGIYEQGLRRSRTSTASRCRNGRSHDVAEHGLAQIEDALAKASEAYATAQASADRAACAAARRDLRDIGPPGARQHGSCLPQQTQLKSGSEPP
jgi:hypothetical protein